MKRANTVKLIVDKEINEKLKELGIITAKCWNEVNWLRIQQFKKKRKVDFYKTEKVVYERYKQMLKGANVQQVARKNAEEWRGFFSLVKEKKDGKLPKWFKPRPSGYWKDKSGKYKLIILIRNDRYEINENKRIIYLKDFKLALMFKGKLKWHGKHGRLEIIYDEAGRSWYAFIPVEVKDVAEVKGHLRASVDLGIVNLATTYVEDGKWYIFKGGGVLSQYEYYSKRISKVQKVLAIHKQRKSRKIKLLHDKRRRYLKHALNSMVRKIMEELRQKGISKVIIGYPKEISRNHGNKLTVNFWNYSYVIKRFEEIGEEIGIKVVKVDESYTSKTCSLCGEVHESGRIKRGLFKCPHMGKVINADLNGAVNILHIPESLGSTDRGFSVVRDRGNWLKTQPVVYCWTNGAGWVEKPLPTSYEVMKMKVVNHKPMIRPEGTLALQGGEEVSEASKLPFKDKTFDTALLLEILEHVDDVEKVLKEALRVSKIAIVSYPNETYDECKTRRPDINEFIDRLYNMDIPYKEGDLGFKAHYHWKNKERIEQDINTLRKLCSKEYKLDYGIYDGWGFVCEGVGK